MIDDPEDRPSPLYLTDAERPLRPRLAPFYRHSALFMWRGIRYLRWFTDPRIREAYLANLPGVNVLNRDTEREPDQVQP